MAPDRSASAAPRSAPRRGAATRAGTSTPPRGREAGERLLVYGILIVFAVIAVALGYLRVVANEREAKAREAMTKTFSSVHTQQRDYRAIFGRFATWPELEERGMRVPPDQSLEKWNADLSHWFVSLKDRQTGLICDRTGEIFDEDAGERVPTCRPAR